MTIENLSEIYELFGYGIIAGGLASAIVWAVGYAIQAFTSWLSQS